MKFEPITVTTPLNGDENAVNIESTKHSRLPRWTRQEILILIQGKKTTDSVIRRARASGLEFGSGQLEPKWSTISSYCKKLGVDRGPMQCRKRWSNLAGDFKKIKEYENKRRDEMESFWGMRSELRREKKLPGFFDKEVYDILCGGEEGGGGPMEVDPESVFDSGRRAEREGDFGGDKEAAPSKDLHAPTKISLGTANEKEPALDEGLGSTQRGNKRKRFTPDEGEEEIHWQQHLIKTLERNGNLLSSQLEAQINRYELEREQQKDHATNLVAVLSKVADALGKIADKL